MFPTDRGSSDRRSVSKNVIGPDLSNSWMGDLSIAAARFDFFAFCAKLNTRCKSVRGSKMKNLCWAFLVVLLAVAVHAGETRSVRDAQGRTKGTVYTNDNRSTYRDAQGRVVATSTRSGNTATYRDASGRLIGTQTVSGDRTTFRDAQGRVVFTSTQSGSTTTYRDASGRMTGSATTSNTGTTTYRDAQGRVRATQR